MNRIKLTVFLSLGLVIGLIANASVALAEPHCNRCPYSCYDLGLGHKDCSELSESRGLCCVDLSSKGLKLAQEQERVLGSNAAANDRCPSGFSPSENKCSVEERRRGCKDMRLPSGLGCVHR